MSKIANYREVADEVTLNDAGEYEGLKVGDGVVVQTGDMDFQWSAQSPDATLDAYTAIRQDCDHEPEACAVCPIRDECDDAIAPRPCSRATASTS